MAGTQVNEWRFAPINISSATTTTLVAAVSGFAISVVALCFSTVGASCTIKFQDDAGSPVVLTGVFPTSIVVAQSAPANGFLFSTTKGQALTAVTTGTVSVQGYLVYKLTSN